MEPHLTLAEAKASAATKPFPRITEDGIKAAIGAVDYMRKGTLTICIITMRNGFHIIGKAAPADERNFDPLVGERYAYEDAFKQIWPLEGYRLRCELALSEAVGPGNSSRQFADRA